MELSLFVFSYIWGCVDEKEVWGGGEKRYSAECVIKVFEVLHVDARRETRVTI